MGVDGELDHNRSPVGRGAISYGRYGWRLVHGAVGRSRVIEVHEVHYTEICTFVHTFFERWGKFFEGVILSIWPQVGKASSRPI